MKLKRKEEEVKSNFTAAAKKVGGGVQEGGYKAGDKLGGDTLCTDGLWKKDCGTRTANKK